MNFTDYLQAIGENLQRGNATEHTHRPALKTLLDSLGDSITATNEPKRSACGAPDFSVARGSLTIGYVEAKDVDAPLDEVERSEQLQRYRKYLANLLLTDGLEFRWYVEGERRAEARLGRWSGGKLKRDGSGAAAVATLLDGFASHQPEPVATPSELARHLARLAHMIRDVVRQAFERGQASSDLTGLREAFAATLLPELSQPEHLDDFADMYAQTLAYGLFAARTHHAGSGTTFDRYHAAHDIPKTNPLLRDLFDYLTGTALDGEPHVGFVNDLVQLLAQARIDDILRDFGKRTKQEDPVVHFYETFLQQYDPNLRELRGVYYTPEPVVGYIVRSVDWLLREKFGLADGLADRSTIDVPIETMDEQGKAVTRIEKQPKVLILDPACGTGTFLYRVVDHIREQFRASNNAGMWAGYVRDHLLPRLFGFELLMAPYAVAHLKLGMQLAAQDLPEEERERWAYDFAGDERLQVYLTNTLEEPEKEVQTLWGPLRAISDEAKQAGRVKTELPIMVVLGNPPYSGHSANRSRDAKGKPTFIGRLIEDYKQFQGHPLVEQNSKWLHNDYVKFVRWSQWRIDRTGAGVLAFITDNSYMDSPTFRGVRESLLTSFDYVWLIDLHGNARKREVADDGTPDSNVFDIQQGVAIVILAKAPEHQGLPACQVSHYELQSSRSDKYQWLDENDITTTAWSHLEPKPPYMLLQPIEGSGESEYQGLSTLKQLMPLNGWGIATRKDYLLIAEDRDELVQRFSQLRNLPPGQARQELQIKQPLAWIQDAQLHLAEFESHVRPILYRPFDIRWTVYIPQLIERGDHRWKVMQHLLRPNPSLITTRITKEPFAALTYNGLSEHKASVRYDGTFVFPLYLYPDPTADQGKLLDDSTWPPGPDGRTPNLDPAFVKDIQTRLDLTFVTDGAGDLAETFGPEDIFHWIYGIFHAPSYRARYAEFLKIDFPRIPLTDDLDLFRAVCGQGQELVRLHLLRDIGTGDFLTSFPERGENEVAKGYPKYSEAKQRVRINPEQHFDGVPPEVWAFQVGGYQVLDKWLKDRRGRRLSDDDLLHYQKVVVALRETIRRMAAIEQVIEQHGGWPLPGQVPEET